MRIVVTGINGQVAQSLAERAAAHQVTVIRIGRPECDLADPCSMEAAVRRAEGDVVVNAAAYTAVDQAESVPDLAHAINAEGAGCVAAGAAALSLPVVQLSTDYVFDGASERPYRETDPVAPLGVYGRSKLEGERRVALANGNHAILRTAWVYSPFGKNFLKTMLRLACVRDAVGVVADQRGSPTSALDIADGVIAVCRNLVERPNDRSLRGLFHMTGAGFTTWAEFAELVFAQSRRLDGPTATVRRIATSDYPTPARRPANSMLDCAKLATVHGVVLPGWHVSAVTCIERLARQAA